MGQVRVRASNRLSAVKVARLRVPGIYEDGSGLRLIVTDRGAKRWVLRLTIGGRRTNRGLGVYPDVTLEAARREAEKLRGGARAGRDIRAEERRGRRMTADVTFRQAFEGFFAIKKPSLRNAKHANQWRSMMSRYVFPAIGDKLVGEITAQEVIAILQPIWLTKPETARRCLQRMEATFESAILRGYRERASPCVGVRRELGSRRPPVRHYRSLPWKEVPAFVRALGQRRMLPSTKLALAFTVHTCCRSEEVRGARWEEIDFGAQEWRVPRERMKMKVEHVVPLSMQAIAILRTAKTFRPLDRRCALVFPSTNGRMLSDNALSKFMRDNEIAGTPHGFRTSFKTWAAEHGVRDEVSEAVLAHGDPNKVRAAYRRTTYLDERRELMRQWSDFVDHISDLRSEPLSDRAEPNAGTFFTVFSPSHSN
jgi:integrase